VIRLVVMMYVRFPLSLRNVEDLLFERGIDICHKTVQCGGTGSVQCSPEISAASGSVACKASAHNDRVLEDDMLRDAIDDRAYYLKRAREERSKSATSIDASATAIRRQMAKDYDTMARRLSPHAFVARGS
jgi:hypothetical protein